MTYFIGTADAPADDAADENEGQAVLTEGGAVVPPAVAKAADAAASKASFGKMLLWGGLLAGGVWAWKRRKKK